MQWRAHTAPLCVHGFSVLRSLCTLLSEPSGMIVPSVSEFPRGVRC